MKSRLIIALLYCWIASSSLRADNFLQIHNLKNGETLRYPVALLKGTVSMKVKTLKVINTASKRDTREMKGLVHRGRFKALVEPVPGNNSLSLVTNAGQETFTLNYKPQTNPYFVRVIYMTDSKGDKTYITQLKKDRQNYEAKLDTALKLMQTFTAETMHAQGYGRLTFHLELNDNGKVKVHTAKGDQPAEKYYALNDQEWWRRVYSWSGRDYPMRKAKNIVIAAYTRWDPVAKKAKGHTALGGGGLALFGSGGLFTWPSHLSEVIPAFADATLIDSKQVFDDSAYRGTFWAMASTTLGATLHELGHTFGLPHCKDPRGIMTRGFDHFHRMFTFIEPSSKTRRRAWEPGKAEQPRFSPISCAALAPSRWFALDKKDFSDRGRPSLSLNEKKDSVVIKSTHGIRYIGLDVKGDAVAFEDFSATKAPKEHVLSFENLKANCKTTDVRIRIIDNQGIHVDQTTSRLLRRRR